MKPTMNIWDVDFNAVLSCKYPNLNNGYDANILTYSGAKHLGDSLGGPNVDDRRLSFHALLEEHIKPKPPAPKRPRFYSTDSLDVSTLVSGMQRQVVRRIDNGLTSVRTEVQSVGTTVRAEIKNVGTTITSTMGAAVQAVGSLQSNVNSNHSDMVAKMEKLQRINVSLDASLEKAQKALADEQKAHDKTRSLLKTQQFTTQKKETCIGIQINDITDLKKQLAKGNDSKLSMQVSNLEKLVKANADRTETIAKAVSSCMERIPRLNKEILDAVRNPRPPPA